MKYLSLLSLALLTAPFTLADEPATKTDAPAADAPADSVVEPVKFRFTDVKVIPTTSVKDQNKSGTCWCFASTSFMEDEIVRNGGDSLDLSEMFTVRQCYLEKADRYLRMDGKINFAAGGSAIDVPYIWEKYGAVPESVYPGIKYGEDKHVHAELDAVLKGYLDGVLRNGNRRYSTAWRQGLEGILDAYLGAYPASFEVNGKTYTPRSYADHLGLTTGDYVPLTSFSHHPFYTKFAMEVADNWLWADYYNLPLDEFKAVIDNAVEQGYPIVWAADVSEGGFKWTEGFAVMPVPTDEKSLEGTELSRWVKMSDKDRANKQFDVHGPCKEITVTQESRQKMFDRHETTDDHGMEIVGYAKDQEGNRFYKVKNSWDTNQVYDGFFYVSEPYLLAKTIDIYVHRDAIPKDIRKKLKL
ncbi:MAG: aminopeptidase [Muribaculaceae bacterium]|nr:aminopeptidase [Muribaculaceae bacterium]